MASTTTTSAPDLTEVASPTTTAPPSATGAAATTLPATTGAASTTLPPATTEAVGTTLAPPATGAAATTVPSPIGAAATTLPAPPTGAAGTTTVPPSGPAATTVPAPSGAAATTTVPASANSDLVPPASVMPYSVFNSASQNWATIDNSVEYVNDFVSDYQDNYGSVGVNTAPVYWVSATQADSPITVSSGCNDFTADTGTEVPIPSYVALNGSGDDPLMIYQPSTGTGWELWQVQSNPDGSYSACWGGKLDMSTSSGVFQDPFGLSATGISYLSTMITEADVASGSIDHAIAVAIPGCHGYVFPADRQDCRFHPGDIAGQPPEGQWFHFPADLAMPSGLTPFGQMVFKAIQTYGMVVTDYAGAVMLEAEQPSDWAAEGNSGTDPISASWDGQPEYRVVANLPWAQLVASQPG